MKRSELKEIISSACERAGVVGTNRERLVNSADLTDRIAVGTFKVDKTGAACGCPATVAGLYVPSPYGGGKWTTDDTSVQRFPGYFDGSFRQTDLVKVGEDDAFIPVTD